jgi:hypothetical protein
MKKYYFNRIVCLASILSFCLVKPLYSQCLPSLGSASGFTIFTITGAVSNVTSSTITGDIGTNAGLISGFESSTVSGVFHNADSVTQSAALNLSSAYTSYQNLAATNTSHTPSFGSGETITPGVYYIGSAGSVAGTLTLDAQNNPGAKFILKFEGAFTSGAGTTVVLSNGASINNIYWIANGAFSLAANTTFKGTVIANGAISIGAGAFLNCKLFSVNGAISTYGTSLSNSGIDNSSVTYYADTDLDGYGDANVPSCYSQTGYVSNNSDCNDTNAAINPNATEIYGNGIDDNCNGITDTDAVGCAFSTTWNGTSWSNGIPDSTKLVIFAGNYTVLDNLNACSIQVTNNAQVTVESNVNVLLYGPITVETGSSYALSNNSNLIQVNPLAVNIGNIVVKRNTSTIVRLDHTMWSSPVTGQNLYNFSPETLTHRFYTYDTNTDTFLSSTINSSSEFSPTKGYAIRAPNNQSSTVPAEWTGVFSGVPNNGTLTFPLNYSATNSYNLIGNPYASAINANTFLAANSTNIEGTIYFYQHTLSMNASGLFPTGTNFASLTNTGGTAATEVLFGNANYHTPAVIPNGIIQVGQGFFVKAKNSGTLTFTNSMRVPDQNHQFNKTTTTEKNRLWLNLKSEDGSDINQILVGYLDGATQGVDSNFDGLSYGNIGSFLYSTINGDSYVIQGRALPFGVNDLVPLGFKCTTAGNYSIKLTNMDGLFLGNQDVFIRDNLTATVTNIKTAPYTFTSEMGTFNNRFEIVYNQALGLPSSNFNKEEVIVYKNAGSFHVSTKGIVLKDIRVFDISGRLIYKLNALNTTTAALIGLPQTKQVVFIKLISQDNQTVTIKVIN